MNDIRRSRSADAFIRVAILVALAAVLAAIPQDGIRAHVADPPSSLTFSALGSRLLSVAASRTGSTDSNTVLSPVSAGLALSLTSMGARGATAGAMSHVLGTAELSRTQLADAGAAMLAASRDRRDVQLEIANAVWIDSAAALTPEFRASVAAWHSRSGVIALHSTRALAAINQWTDSATDGKIERLLTEPLPDTTVMFVGSAVYFKGKWAQPFDKSATRPRDFTLTSGRKISVSAMSRSGRSDYWRESGYQMLRIPYGGGLVSMYVILPDSNNIAALEASFAQSGWPRTNANRQNRPVDLVLPKLHVEQELDLIPSLRRLGAGIAFDCNRADFRDLAVARNGREIPLCIGKVVQKVYLDVNEEGTQAAAVTGIGVVTTTAIEAPVKFVVDRPFLIVIRDDKSGADLFVGSIMHP